MRRLAAVALLLLAALPSGTMAARNGPLPLVPSATPQAPSPAPRGGGSARGRLDWHTTRGPLRVVAGRDRGRTVLELTTPPGTAAAFFLRPGRLVAVLAMEPTAEQLDARAIARGTGLLLREKTRGDGMTVYWFDLPRPYALEVGRRGSGVWRVVLHEDPAALPRPRIDPARALAGLRGTPLEVVDTVAGERMAVVPSTMPGASPGGAMLDDRLFMPAALGIVWRWRDPGHTPRSRDGAAPAPVQERIPPGSAPGSVPLSAPGFAPVTVSSPQPPLALPDAPEAPAAPARTTSAGRSPRPGDSLLGLAGWQPPRDQSFLARRRDLEATLGGPPSARLPTLLELARLHLAAAQPAEALVRVEQAEATAAAEAAQAEITALRAAAAMLRGAADAPVPGDEPELSLWQAIREGTPAPPPERLPAGYPPALQRRLGLELAERLAGEKRFEELAVLVERLLALQPPPREAGRLRRLAASSQEGLGSWRAAVRTLEQIAAGDLHNGLPAMAERMRLGVEHGEIPAKAALDRLAPLMPAWRGNPDEPLMLRLLARLAEENGRPLLAVEAWQHLLATGAGGIAGEVGVAFERLLAALLAEEPPAAGRLMAALAIVGRLPADALGRPGTASLVARLGSGLAAGGLPLTAARLLARTAASTSGSGQGAPLLLAAADYALAGDDPDLANRLLDRLGPAADIGDGPTRLRARAELARERPELALARLQGAAIPADDPLFARAALAAGRLDLLAAAREHVPVLPEQRLVLALALAQSGDEEALARLVRAERELPEQAAAALAPRLSGPPEEVLATLDQESAALHRLLGNRPRDGRTGATR